MTTTSTPTEQLSSPTIRPRPPEDVYCCFTCDWDHPNPQVRALAWYWARREPLATFRWWFRIVRRKTINIFTPPHRRKYTSLGRAVQAGVFRRPRDDA